MAKNGTRGRMKRIRYGYVALLTFIMLYTGAEVFILSNYFSLSGEAYWMYRKIRWFVITGSIFGYFFYMIRLGEKIVSGCEELAHTVGEQSKLIQELAKEGRK